MDSLEDQLRNFPVQLKLAVHWGDMDAAQHVNNLIYLRWFESARVDYFTALGWDVTPRDGEAGFILAWQDCKYIFPVTYPDAVIVGIRISEIKQDRFLMECKIFSQKHQRLAAIATGTVVTYDYNALNKVAIPQNLRHRIKKLEGSVSNLLS